MLLNQVQTYYYVNCGNNFTFEQCCLNMQLFFEGPKWQYFNLIKWQTISFNYIILANHSILTTKCIYKVCTKFDTIQQSVYSAYHSIVQVCKNIIQACKSDFMPAASLISLLLDIFSHINNLYNFIVNYKTIYNPT